MKLGGFTYAFAEITVEMSPETVLRWLRSRNPQTIYPHAARKSSRKPGIFRHFSTFLREYSRVRKTGNVKSMQIRQGSRALLSMPTLAAETEKTFSTSGRKLDRLTKDNGPPTTFKTVGQPVFHVVQTMYRPARCQIAKMLTVKNDKITGFAICSSVTFEQAFGSSRSRLSSVVGETLDFIKIKTDSSGREVYLVQSSLLHQQSKRWPRAS